jgi:hypothetical protein
MRLQVDAVAADQTDDAPAHRRQQVRHVGVGRRRRRHKAPRSVGLLFERTLRPQGMEVNVDVQR